MDKKRSSTCDINSFISSSKNKEVPKILEIRNIYSQYIYSKIRLEEYGFKLHLGYFQWNVLKVDMIFELSKGLLMSWLILYPFNCEKCIFSFISWLKYLLLPFPTQCEKELSRDEDPQIAIYCRYNSSHITVIFALPMELLCA